MNFPAIVCGAVILGCIVYFFIALGGREIEPNDPAVTRDSGQLKFDRNVHARWFYADRGFRRWLDIISRKKNPRP